MKKVKVKVEVTVPEGKKCGTRGFVPRSGECKQLRRKDAFCNLFKENLMHKEGDEIFRTIHFYKCEECLAGEVEGQENSSPVTTMQSTTDDTPAPEVKMKTCPQCGKEFEVKGPKKFCSPACRAKMQAERLPKPKEDFPLESSESPSDYAKRQIEETKAKYAKVEV